MNCSLSLAVAFLLITACNAGNHRETSPPNILWITCEDISPALGCYGDPYASTPTLDRLAADGLRYTRAYATAPICSPARSTLITGMYATGLGTQHLRSDISVPEDLRILPEYLREAGYFCSNNAKTDYNFDPSGRWDDQGNQAHWRNREEGQPFFSVFNFGITHEGPANRLDEADVEELLERHQPASAHLPPYFPDTPAMRRLWAHQYDLVSVLDRRVEELLAQLEEDGLKENTIVFFFSDHGFGLPRYKRWLYQSGLHVPLIVHIPDSYAHLAGAERTGVEHRLVSFVDFAPTVLSMAGVNIPGRMQGVPFLGKVRGGEKEYLFGARSRADDIYEVSRSVMDDQFIYIRHFMPFKSYVTDAVIFSDRKAGFRELNRLRAKDSLPERTAAFWEPKGWDELYDLVNDPLELNNLAGDPAYREKTGELRQVLYGWMTGHRDLGLLNESMMMMRSLGTTPYEMGHSSSYDVERILEAADRCGKPGVSREVIREGLRDRDPAIRYWSVLSLQAAGPASGPDHRILRQMVEDASPTVAIAAAELLAHWDEPLTGVPVLARYLRDGPHPTVVLQAAISLRNLGPAARTAIPVIERVYPRYRGEVWGRYRDWIYSMFIGFALDQVYVNCGMEVPR